MPDILQAPSFVANKQHIRMLVQQSAVRILSGAKTKNHPKTLWLWKKAVLKK